MSVSRSGFSSVENRPILEQILTFLSVRGPSCTGTRIKSGSIQEMSRYGTVYASIGLAIASRLCMSVES